MGWKAPLWDLSPAEPNVFGEVSNTATFRKCSEKCCLEVGTQSFVSHRFVGPPWVTRERLIGQAGGLEYPRTVRTHFVEHRGPSVVPPKLKCQGGLLRELFGPGSIPPIPISLPSVLSFFSRFLTRWVAKTRKLLQPRSTRMGWKFTGLPVSPSLNFRLYFCILVFSLKAPHPFTSR